MLYFRHGEFSDPQQTSARGDFVSEGATDLSRGEGEFVIGIIEESWEVEEMPLRRLWTQEPWHLACRADRGGEHEIKEDRGRDVVPGVRIFDSVCLDEAVKFIAGIVVKL
jgi:hypothetical protein